MSAHGLRRWGTVAVLVAMVLLALVSLRQGRHTEAKSGHGPESASASQATVATEVAADVATASPALERRTQASAESSGPSVPGIDAEAARCMANYRERLATIHEDLGPAGSPSTALDRALAALSAHGAANTPEASERWQAIAQAELRQARLRWPGNRDLAWFSANHCEIGRDCAEALHHLLGLEPGNAAVWLIAMASAWRQGDHNAYEEALQHAAATPVYDSRDWVFFLRMQPLLAAVHRPPECIDSGTAADLEQLFGRAPEAGDLAAIEAMSIGAGFARVVFPSLEGCREKAVAGSPSRRSACIALLSLLADSDNFLEHSIALPRLITLTRGTALNADARERYRRSRWILQLMREPLPAGAGLGYVIDIGNIDAMRNRAIAQGRWPPPPDWLPEDKAARALITNGERSRD